MIAQTLIMTGNGEVFWRKSSNTTKNLWSTTVEITINGLFLQFVPSVVGTAVWLGAWQT
jgi:hypothetical protein